MSKYGVAVLAIVSLFAGARSRAADGDLNEAAVAKELQAFQGSWRLVSKEVDGKKFSEEQIKDVIATNDGSGRFSVRRGDKVLGAGAVQLGPATKPKTIDVTFTEGERKGQTVLGVYEIEGDTFRVCVARPGEGRAADFSTEVGTGRTLVVYKRETK
jgi:uncharacterized protein (TIGR03067 family)